MARFESPILSFLKDLVRSALGRPETSRQDVLQDLFKKKYNSFQELLESNSELLRLISDMEVMLEGRELFGLSAIRSQTSRVVFHAMRMIRAFEQLSGKPSPVLKARLADVQEAIKVSLETRPGYRGDALVLEYGDIGREMVDAVGGKSANLGEIKNRAGLRVPDGFAISTNAFRLFFDQAGLWEDIRARKLAVTPDDPATLQAVSEEIQSLILSASVPSQVEAAIQEAHARLVARMGVPADQARVAMRSSALGEDGELSFAGQYLTMLNVPADRLVNTYKYVVASLYTPRAMSYRLLKGIADEGVSMSVACLAMVDCRAAGVLFTRHPFNADDRIIVNAVWGLGANVVDGKVAPDSFVLDKSPLALAESKVAHKPFRLTAAGRSSIADEPVPEAERDLPCLTEEQLLALGRIGLALESHYGCAQDVEWGLDQAGGLVVLQSRPLGVNPVRGEGATPVSPPTPGHELLLEGGDPACPGTGSGPVHLVLSDDDLETFPPGAILVAPHSSPKFMVAMPRAQAILTDFGSVTGHMAALSREFRVPTVLGLKNATRSLAQGMEITVDALNGRVYRGRVSTLLKVDPARQTFMAGTQVHDILKQVAVRVIPLHLLDPKSPDFKPESCQTVHDIMRLLHELSYGEMFRISDLASGERGMALRVDAPTGLDLYLIDLGGGVRPEAADGRGVAPDMVDSVPFRALLKGLVLARDQIATPRPVHLKGFLSVMGEQLVASNRAGVERFGEKSYAIVSDKYLNFSSRVGYHYGVLDCYCGKTVNKNYITFSFKGGAADDVKRSRRARAIALMLEAHGFSVEARADRVVGRFQKYEPAIIEEKLVVMGRLLQYTRQTDMLMVDEASVQAMADSFLEGHSHFDPSRNPPPAA